MAHLVVPCRSHNDAATLVEDHRRLCVYMPFVIVTTPLSGTHGGSEQQTRFPHTTIAWTGCRSQDGVTEQKHGRGTRKSNQNGTETATNKTNTKDAEKEVMAWRRGGVMMTTWDCIPANPQPTPSHTHPLHPPSPPRPSPITPHPPPSHAG